LRFFTCPTLNTYAQWPFDEVGFRNEDWIYREEETFSATVVGIGKGQGRIYVKNYTPPPKSSDIYKQFTRLTVRNYGQEGKPKRLQRQIKPIDAKKKSTGFNNGFVATKFGGYLSVSQNGEKPEVDHDLTDWEAGDRIAVHRAAGGVVRVDVSRSKVEVLMLDTKGAPVMYPDRYDQAGQEVRVTICDEQYDEDGDGVADACGDVPNFSERGAEKSDLPGGSDGGKACACAGNFDGDLDVDGTDAATFRADFGRSLLKRPCRAGDPCNGDFSGDGDVDGSDAAIFRQDFGRSRFRNPCPARSA